MTTATDMDTTSRTISPTRSAWTRWLPLAGAAYGLLTLAGDLTIGDFPDENTSAAALQRYYATHHADVGHGGRLMVLGALFLGLFVAGLLVRSRRSSGAMAIIAVGGAAAMAMEVVSASTYALLGDVATGSHLAPAALQAWHVSGAAFGSSIATAVLMLGVAVAGLVDRVLPRWVGASALVIAVGLNLPGFGFLFSMLALPWAVVVGIALAVRHDRV